MDFDSPYSYYNMSRGEQKQYVDEARKIALEMRKATSNEIALSLAAAAKEYKKLLAKFYSTKDGQVSKLKARLAKLNEQKKLKISYGIRKSLEVNCFKDYINMLTYDNRHNLAEIIEKHVDNLYRREDTINRMINDRVVDNLTREIVIPPNYRVKVNTLQLCQTERAIWVEGKFPIKNMSSEKAGRFLSSAQKRANETGTLLAKLDQEISSVSEQLKVAQAQAASEEAKEERKKFNEASKKFSEELNNKLGQRIELFLKSETDSPFKSQISKTLKNAQKTQIEKKKKPCPLICPQTLLYLVHNVNNGNIQLPQEQSQQI